VGWRHMGRCDGDSRIPIQITAAALCGLQERRLAASDTGKR